MKAQIFVLSLIFFLGFNTAYGLNQNFSLPLSGNIAITTNPGTLSHQDQFNRYAFDLVGSDSILSVGAGQVRCAGAACDPSGLGGICVIIYHPEINLDSEYCHLGSASVAKGDSVVKGEVIGIMGSTGGESTGKHLHFSFLNSGSLISHDYSSIIDFSGLPGYNPNVGGSSGQKVNPINLGEIGNLISKFYNYALAIGGVTAILIIVYGGVLYIYSAGNASRQTEAKEWIKAAIFGLALLLLSYLILNTINPCLVGRASCLSS